MRVLYADSSALGRAFIPGEPEHRDMRTLLRDSDELVITSELARLEVVRAVHAAQRARRAPEPADLLTRFDGEVGPDRRILTLRLDPPLAIATARRLVSIHPLGSLDAIHLAVALIEADQLVADQELVFVTRDRVQREAAVDEGLAVA